MSETPAWLSGASDAPAPTTSAPLEVSSPTSNSSNAASSVYDDDKDLPSVILMMRLLNIGMAGGIIASAVRISSRVLPLQMLGLARLMSLLMIHYYYYYYLHRLFCWSGFPPFLFWFLLCTAFAEACWFAAWRRNSSSCAS